MSLERDLDLHADEELLVPKDEPQDVEQPHAEDHGVAKTLMQIHPPEMVEGTPGKLID